MPINQPSGQIKLTNVSLVRMKKGKKRFEIACYQNKVQDWRKGVEKDLDEVLQIPQVFFNVSKGQVASNEDLKSSFGTTDHDTVILEILKKGELQVGEKERNAKSAQLHAEMLQMVASKCVNPVTKRPYPTTIIDKALHEAGFTLVASKSAKISALDAIKLLVEKQVIPISRARMKIRITVASPKEAKRYNDKIKALVEKIEDEDWSSTQWELVAYIEPGNFRIIDEYVRDESKGKGSVEILETAVIQEGDESL